MRKPEGVAMKHATHRKKVIVHQEEGLQMQFAAHLAQEAQKFASRIHFVYNELKVDAKSILDILTLAAGNGAVLAIEAQGHDAYAAIRHLANSFDPSAISDPPQGAAHHDILSETHL